MEQGDEWARESGKHINLLWMLGWSTGCEVVFLVYRNSLFSREECVCGFLDCSTSMNRLGLA